MFLYVFWFHITKRILRSKRYLEYTAGIKTLEIVWQR